MIYLDNASTTNVDPTVFNEMTPYFTLMYHNASSNYLNAKAVKLKIEESREICAKIINCDASEIVFTSGATESINMALKGYMEENFDKGNHIITCKTEHKAVLKTCEYLETKGIDVTYLDVNKDGAIDLAELESSINSNTALISIMLVNNETGVIHDLKKISEIAQKYNITVFCDATQALGKITVDVQELGIDMLCMSAHKINGPKGIGFLYFKKHIKLSPLLHGGSQENNMRSGTYNTPLIVGLGKACDLASSNLQINQKHSKKLFESIIEKLATLKSIEIIALNTNRVFNIINMRVTGLDASFFVESNKEINVSNGSACTSRIIEGSHVLKAMGFSDIEASECLRISFDKNTTEEELNILYQQLKNVC
ncbi:cysteine desulfurase family protein [Chryseobacterium caseinilyticum]|uniref:cysteine desulfurase n=1 Tax=Chryseobacterium caseinilyticum TaxID=2771428 RepID=A0ABR8ZD55_9FLAO|nr:cysteine desulfurase family protein [Chryseobacterium caseinilyticum]MBD8083009.1 cysteine desulfurase [Chryseobacterium caseinilyticum]